MTSAGHLLGAAIALLAGAASAQAQPSSWRLLWQPAASEVQMARPCSRADLTHVAARAGLLALSQPDAHTVKLYDIGDDRFAPAATIGGPGKHASQFDGPSGVAIDPQRRLLFVSDTNNHRIQIFRLSDAGAPPTATFAKSVGRQGTALGELDRPTGLSLDAHGNLYVIEKGNRRVQVFAADLTPARVVGGADTLPDPVAIAAPRPDAIYVADARLRRVQVFAGDGAAPTAVGKSRGAHDEPATAGAFFQPADLAVSNDGTLLVTDCGDHVVQRFDARGAVLTPWGRFGADEGALNQPRAIAVDERDRVIVLDFSSRRAQIFSPTGAFARAVNLVSRAKQVTPVP